MEQHTQLLHCNTSFICLCEGNKQNKVMNLRMPK